MVANGAVWFCIDKYRRRKQLSDSKLGRVNGAMCRRGCSPVRCVNVFKIWVALREIVPRFAMLLLFLHTERMSPFNRYIHPDEMWLYRNPRRDPYVTNLGLWSIVILTPLTMAVLHFIAKRERDDFVQLILAVTLSLGLNCILTNMVKLIVGRPRPDFFWRCFPDGEMNSEMQCTGPKADVIEGRKSFPSGHSSISFSSLGIISWWMMGKLHVWSTCKGVSWRFLLSVAPLVTATCVALSRTCDYHHHWQDVIIGSLLGLTISYGCYRQYYPALNSQQCHKPYVSGRQMISTIPRRESDYSMSPYSSGACLTCRVTSSSENLADLLIDDLNINEKEFDPIKKTPLIPSKEPVKWI